VESFLSCVTLFDAWLHDIAISYYHHQRFVTPMSRAKAEQIQCNILNKAQECLTKAPRLTSPKFNRTHFTGSDKHFVTSTPRGIWVWAPEDGYSHGLRLYWVERGVFEDGMGMVKGTMCCVSSKGTLKAGRKNSESRGIPTRELCPELGIGFSPTDG
jgi:hypothetical protein